MGRIKNFIQRFVYHPSITKVETFGMALVDGFALGAVCDAYYHFQKTGNPGDFAYSIVPVLAAILIHPVISRIKHKESMREERQTESGLENSV